MRISGKRKLIVVLLMAMVVTQLCPATMRALAEDNVRSRMLSPGMLVAQGNTLAGTDRRFEVTWLPDVGIAPGGSYTVVASWEGGAGEIQQVSAATEWGCTFGTIPDGVAVTYTLEGLNAERYHCYPSVDNTIAVTEMAETPIIKTWYNTPERYRQPVTVTVTMVSGEDGTPGGTGNIMDSITGLEGKGAGDQEVVVDQMAFRFPKYNSDGKIFHSFEVQEINLDGHLINLDKPQKYNAGEPIYLHNTMQRALRVTKSWDGSVDDGNDEIEVQLIRDNDGQVIDTKRIRKEGDGTWPTIVFDTQPMGGALNGSFQAFSYSVREIGVYSDERPGDNLIDDYNVRYPDAPNWQTTGFAVQNGRKVDEDSETIIEIVKTWDDARTPSFQLSTFSITRLNGGDTSATQVAVTGHGSETASKQVKMPKYDAVTGEECVYHVEENTNADFYNTFERMEQGENKTTWYFTNRSVKRTVTVEKEWHDDNPVSRPDVTLYLLRDGQRIYDPDLQSDLCITLTNGNTQHTFGDLPRFESEGGREYVYTVEESPVPDGYYAVVDGLTVENHQKGSGGDDALILVTKRWETNGKHYEMLPEITLQLYRRVTGQADEAIGEPMVMPAGTSLSKVFAILSGQGITIDPTGSYYVKELTDNGGAWEVIGGEVVFDGNVGHALIRNVLREDLIPREPTYVSLIIRKIWSVSDYPSSYGSLAEYIAALPAEFTLLQSYDGGAFGAPVGDITQTAGSGSYDQDGSARILGNGYIILRVPEMDAQGKRYAYRVEEADIPGFREEPLVSNNSFTFTNTQETIDFHARKTWLNLARRGNMEVPPVVLKLMRGTDTQLEQVGQSMILNDFKYGGSGVDTYRWDETTFGSYATHGYINGAFTAYAYQVTEEYSLTDKRFFTTTGNKVVDGFADIKNTYDRESEKIQFIVNKEWTGGSQGEEYPSVTVALYADGVQLETVELTAGSSVPWSHTFRDLPRYRQGPEGIEPEEIAYTAEETAIGGHAINAENGYTVTIEKDGVEKVYKRSYEYMMGSNEFYAVNHLITLDEDLRYDIIGYKAWPPLPPGVEMPQSVTFVLFKDGQLFRRAVLDENSGWQCVFEDMEYFNTTTQRPYAYLLVEEDPPPGFYPMIESAMRYDRNDQGELYAHATLINIPVDEREVVFIKEWRGDGDDESLRVDQDGNAQVKLLLHYGGGTRTIILTPDENGIWSETVKLPITTEQNGAEFVQYQLEEPGMRNHAWQENQFSGAVEGEADTRNFHLTFGEEQAVVTVVNAIPNEKLVSGAKRWEDALNSAGLRPTSLTVVLEYYTDDGSGPVLAKESGPLTVSTGNSGDIRAAVRDVDDGAGGTVTLWEWTYETDGFTAEGEPYTYRWREEIVPGHYTSAGDDRYSYADADGVKPMVNALELVTLEGEKTWTGPAEEPSLRPKQIEITLLRKVGENGQPETVDSQRVTVSATEAGRWAFGSWPARDEAGDLYTYYVEETPLTGYTTAVTGMDVANDMITGSVTVNKRWVEPEGETGAGRPTGPITITLYGTVPDGANGTRTIGTWTHTITDVSNIDWQYTFADLPLYDASSGAPVRIIYLVEESDIPGYRLAGANAEGRVPVIFGADDTAAEVVLTNEAYRTSLTVTKRWVGDDAVWQQARPQNIRFALAQYNADGALIDTHYLTITQDAQGNWPTERFESLQYEDAQGRPYRYDLTEMQVPGYDTAIAPVEEDGLLTGFLVTNTMDTVDIALTKAWDERETEAAYGAQIATASRPDAVEVTLIGTAGGREVYRQTHTLRPAGWAETVRGLPRYANGSLVTYRVAEEGYAAYETEVDASGMGPSEQGGYSAAITNRLKTETVQVRKVFAGDDAMIEAGASPKPASILIHLYRRTAQGGQDAAFHLTQTIDGITGDADSYTTTFTALPLYDKQGNVYEYYADEEPVAGYEKSVSADGREITNTLDTTRLTGVKRWQDTANADGEYPSRPSEVRLVLTRSVGGTPDTGFTLAQSLPYSREAEQSWAFENLTRLAPDGTPYTYEVEEVTVAGYAVTYDRQEQDDIPHIIITNTPLHISIQVDKTWQGDARHLTYRPADGLSIRLVGTGQDGRVYYDGTKVMPVPAAADDPWRVTFTDAPRYGGDEKLIRYTVSEASMPAYELVSLVQPEVDADEGKQLYHAAITNRLIAQDIVVNKRWEDEDNAGGTRPASIDIELLSSSGVRYLGVMTGARGWTFTFAGLPKYTATGALITYTLSERVPNGYVGRIVQPESGTGAQYTATITNALIEDETQVSVRKEWSGGNAQARPQVTIYLMDGTRRVDTVRLGGDTLTHTFTGLAKYRTDGTEIQYTVYEVPVANYTTAIRRIAVNDVLTYIITNTYQPPATATPTPTPTRPPRTSTPSPTPTARPTGNTGRLYTIEDMDVPLGYGSGLNVGDCFD